MFKDLDNLLYNQMLKCVIQTLGPIIPRAPFEDTREALWALQTMKGTPWSATVKGVHRKLRWPYHRTRETIIPMSKTRKGKTRKSMSQNAHVSNTRSHSAFIWLIKSTLSKISVQVKILSAFADLKTAFTFLLKFLLPKLNFYNDSIMLYTKFPKLITQLSLVPFQPNSYNLTHSNLWIPHS